MKDLGYGRDYQYAHSVPDAYIPQEYLPTRVAGSVLYEPGAFGFEKDIAKRLAWWAELRERYEQPDESDGGSARSASQEPGGQTEDRSAEA
jgi:putative ATPase